MARYFQDYIKPSLFAGQPSCGHYGLGVIEFRCFFRVRLSDLLGVILKENLLGRFWRLHG